MTDVLIGRKRHMKMDTQVEDGPVMMDTEIHRYIYKPRNACCWVRELEKARFRKRWRPALYRNRSPLMRQEGAALRLVSCCTNPRKE